MKEPHANEPPSPMFRCECGQSIHKQEGDQQLTCYNCKREYDRDNNLEVIHVLCPWCSTKITDVGRYITSRDPKEWRVDNVDCPSCNYEYEATFW